MKKINFRKMTPQDIEVRIATCKDGNTTLLLYQDSRTTMDELDRVFGEFGWQIHYKTVADQVYGVLSVWDEEKNQWIAKEDTGAESNIQAQKGQSSDILKRCAVRFGWGRELYTTPKINIRNSNKYEKYNVNSITIDDRRTITSLTIADSKGNIVFNWAKGQPQQQYIPQQTNEVEEMNCVEIPKVKPQPQQNYPLGKIANPINEKGYLEPPMFKQIVKCKNMPELKNIWSIYPELHNNKYFKDTINKRKGELEEKEKSLIYMEN